MNDPRAKSNISGNEMGANILAELDGSARTYCAARQERDAAATGLDQQRRRIDALLAELRRELIGGDQRLFGQKP